MVREARLLWSDPFENPSELPDETDEWDDLDLSPLHDRRERRRRTRQPVRTPPSRDPSASPPTTPLDQPEA